MIMASPPTSFSQKDKNFAKPTVAELMRYANVGVNWRQLGIRLKLDVRKLNEIDHQYPLIQDKLSAMYQLWLNSNLGANRSVLIDALRIINENAIAHNYESYISEYCEQPQPHSRPHSAEDDFVETCTLKKRKVFNPQQVTCDNCTTANATGYCKECDKFFCQNCDEVHKKWGPTSNHQITNFEEVTFSALRLVPPSKEETPLTCTIDGHDKLLNFFCKTCERIICHDCITFSHKSHQYDLITNCYQEHCHELERSLFPVIKKVTAVKDIVTAITKIENEIEEQKKVLEMEIHEVVDELVNDIRESGKQLTKKVRRVSDGKLKVLSEQKKLAEISLSNLRSCEESVKQSIESDSQQQVLKSKKQMMESMSQVTQQVNVEELNPKEKADVRLIKNRIAVDNIGSILFSPSTALQMIGISLSPDLLQQCKIKEITNIEHLPEKKMVSFLLSFECPDSSLLTVPVSSIKCSLVPVGSQQPVTTTVTATTHPGVYNIHYTPSTRGRHQVNVQVHDVQLEGTSLVIPFNPYLDTITPVRIIGELNRPSRLAVTENCHIIVTEFWIDRVSVLNKEGKKSKSFGDDASDGLKFSYPRGLAVTPDNFILISDEHRIQKITLDGEYIASVGEKGTKPLQFSRPSSIAISHTTGQIYVADRGNHRIQVLNSDLVFLHSFGSKGRHEEGKFNYIWDIAIDSKGLIYVTDRSNHCILKFTAEEKFIGHFGTTEGPGKLNSPQGITIDATDLVYITEEGNHQVLIYTCEGQFIRSFGEFGHSLGQFNTPRGMAFDKEGVLYICDFTNNRVVVY